MPAVKLQAMRSSQCISTSSVPWRKDVTASGDIAAVARTRLTAGCARSRGRTARARSGKAR
jgi:hypothetical protein